MRSAAALGLTSITIPSSVISIGGRAFYGCAGLQSIEVDIGNPEYSSAAGVLFNTARTILIQYPVGKVGNYTIPSGVISIGDGSLSGCTGLASITIPSSVTGIGDYAFYGCAGLASVTLPSSVTTLGDYAFSGCSGLKSVTIPVGVSGIGWYAFSGCTGLTTIPSSVPLDALSRFLRLTVGK